MKKHILIVVLLVLPSLNSIAQTLSNENFIYTAVPQKAVQAANYNTLTKAEINQSVTYFDGLGRPIQSIAIGQGGGGSDIVTHMEYDGFGRQVKEYLPYPVLNPGNEYLKTAALSETLNFYNQAKYENTANPFSQKEFEASPLNRVLQQAAPGNDWAINNNHTIKLEYQTNSSNEVNLYTVSLSFANNTYTPTLSLSTANGGKYVANELYKTITKDENWIVSDLKNKTTEEFKDKEGRVVLKKTYNLNVPYETYYIYDSYGNLSFVLPPKAEGLTDTNTLNFLAYQYKYDYRNRLVEKKLPGKDWEYIVYDKLDRPILTQDVNLRATNKWIFTKYDAFGRTVYTGEYQNNTQTARTDVQTLVNSVTAQFETKQGINTINGTTVYYSNNAFPNVTTLTLLTINYYDDYSFDLNGSTAAVSYGITPITNAKSLPTGSKIRVLGTSNWITNVSYYDAKGRPIYNYSKNDYLATVNTVKSQLDFPGKTTETTATHTRNSVTTTIIDTFLYDQAGRLLSQKQKVNAQNQEVIAENNYDNLGQLTSKGVGGKINQSRLQNVDYTYNIRGWLKGINDGDNINNTITTGATDLFGFQINYNTPSIGTPLYNGNISQTFWKTANMDSSLKNYTYTYDDLNRLSTATDNLSKFNENVTYDKNGNIMNLTRSGEIVGGSTVPDVNNPAHFGAMDNLTYIYDAGNRLQIVSDSANDTYGFKDDLTGATLDNTTDYGYDSNGNMKSDTNKNISNIVYNYLNLPTQVTIGGLNINYVYDATGTKLQKTVNGLTTDYAEGFIYEANQLKFFSQPEGYAANNSGTFSYIYQYKDHLGNVRLSYGDGNNNGVVGTSEIVEENNYYPFGLKHKGYNSGFVIGSGNSTAQKYKYNGKELQDELGLNFYDYGARNYDPALGRWMNMDPLAEKYFGATPYNYVLDNPVNAIDPDGMDVYLLTESGRTILALKEKGKNTDTMYAVNSKNITDISSSTGNKETTPTIFDMKDTNGDGQFTTKDGVTVKSGIMGEMVNSSGKFNGDDYYSSKGEYNNQNEQDYFSLFKYSSDNSNAEFGLHIFNNKGKSWIQLITDRGSGTVTGPENLGIEQKDIISTYHSHPGIRTSPSIEKFSIQGNTGDSDYGQSYRGNRNYPNYIYFPNSSRLYNVTPTTIDYIKKINNSKDLKN
jgi:RHS repeat-associated protein